jgi:hypothetical protein
MPRQRSTRATSEGSSVACSTWSWTSTGGVYAWLGLGLYVVGYEWGLELGGGRGGYAWHKGEVYS